MSGEVRKILDEKAAVPLWPVAGGLLLAKLKSFALVGLNGFRLLGCANSSASTGRRRDRFPADAHMLALRRAVRAQATSWPQQRQAARDVWTRAYHLGARYCTPTCRKAASKARRRSSTVARKAQKALLPSKTPNSPSRGCLIGPHDYPINVLGGYRFPQAKPVPKDVPT